MSTIRLSFIGLVARSFVLVLTFLSSVVIARGIGPAGVGEYFLVITTASLIATFADWGLSSSAVVFAGDRKHRLFAVGMALLTMSLAVALPLSIALRWLYPATAVWGSSPFDTVAAILISPMVLYNNCWTLMLAGRKEITVANGFQCVTYLLFTAIVIALHLTGLMTVGKVLGTHVVVFGAQMLGQIFLVFAWRRRDSDLPELSGRTALIAQMIRFGLPVYPSTVATMLSLRVGVLMLTAYHGMFASGIYSVAFQLSDKLSLVARSIQDAIYENVIRFKNREAVTALNQYLRSASLVFGGIVLAGILGAPLAVRLFFGQRFVASIRPMQMLIAGGAALGMATLISTYFVGQIRRPAILSWLAVSSAVVSLVVNRLLIPPLGADGAALALLVTQCTVFLLSLVVYLRYSHSRLSSVLVFSREDARELRRRLQARFSAGRPATHP